MSDIARTAAGPKRHPTRNGEPVSKGMPTTATSTPSSAVVCGRRMKVVMPQNRGLLRESWGRNVGMSGVTSLRGPGRALDQELEQRLGGQPDGELGGVVVRRHLDDVEGDQRIPRDHAHRFEQLPGL